MLVLSLLCFSWQCVSSIAVSLVSCSPGHSLPSRGTCWRSPLAWGLLPMETWMWEALGKVFYTQVSWNWILPRWALPHCISAAWVFHVFSCSHQGNRSHLIPTMKCLTAEREKVFYPPLCSFLLLFSQAISPCPNTWLCFTRTFPLWCRENQMSSAKSVHRYTESTGI